MSKQFNKREFSVILNFLYIQANFLSRKFNIVSSLGLGNTFTFPLLLSHPPNALGLRLAGLVPSLLLRVKTMTNNPQNKPPSHTHTKRSCMHAESFPKGYSVCSHQRSLCTPPSHTHTPPPPPPLRKKATRIHTSVTYGKYSCRISTDIKENFVCR